MIGCLMKMNSLLSFSAAAFGALALGACSDPFGFDSSERTIDAAQGQLEEEEEEEICPASEEWLPSTPPLEMFSPLPHPASECPFYRGTWQSFLVATQPDGDGRPDFLSWPTIDTLFVSQLPRGPNRAELGDLRQAGLRQIVIDQNGRAIYYGIHVNQAFKQFVDDNGLNTLAGVRGASSRLFFPAGVVELKSAWQDITDEPAAAYANYITVDSTVPTLSEGANGEIIEDRDTPRARTMALLALHVVYTLPGHPEFIWGTFEHTVGSPDISAADGKRDVAPTFYAANPAASDPDNLMVSESVSDDDLLLYRGGTPANRANQGIAESQLRLEESTQSFPGQQTSIYRMFPASKSHSIDPDAALSSLNHNVGELFAAKRGTLNSNDKRGYYRQVGSVWMDKPDYFVLDSPLANDLTSPLVARGGDPALQAEAQADLAINGGDSDFSILAGEDRLSSTAMESFTQGPGAFPNCFTCHNTQAVTARGIPSARDSESPELLGPKRINVSHIFSEFVRRETQQ